MSAYEDLAWSYDELTTDVDYPALVEYLEALCDRFGAAPKTVLDLACGTGSVSVLLAKKGYSVIGADLSEDMLMVAYNKALDLEENRPLFIHQAMEDLELPQPVDLTVCLLDSLNYITDPQAAQRALERVYKNLNPGGLLILDVNTLAKFRAMDGQVWLDETDDSYCVWRTEFDENTRLCSYGVDLFRRQGKLWQRSFEEHWEYAYTPAQLEEYLQRAGFTRLTFFGDRRLDGPREEDQRIFAAARKA